MDNNGQGRMTDIGDFIEQIIDEQGYETLTPEVKAQLKEDMTQRLMDQIDQAAINELSEEKAIELSNRLDTEEMTNDQIQQFMRDAGVNLEEVTLATMLQFKMLYAEEPQSEAVTPVNEG